MAGARVERDRLCDESGETVQINNALHFSSEAQGAGRGQDGMGELDARDLHGQRWDPGSGIRDPHCRTRNVTCCHACASTGSSLYLISPPTMVITAFP